VVNLCGTPDTSACSTEGVIAHGTFSATNLTGPLAGKSLQDLVDEMRADQTYANAHTANYPGGEVRGQIHGVGTDDKGNMHDGQHKQKQHDDGDKDDRD
jgi:hypothetical protein